LRPVESPRHRSDRGEENDGQPATQSAFAHGANVVTAVHHASLLPKVRQVNGSALQHARKASRQKMDFRVFQLSSSFHEGWRNYHRGIHAPQGGTVADVKLMAALAMLAVGCAAGSVQDESGSQAGSAQAGGTRISSPAVLEPEPDIRAMITPNHGDLTPWALLDSAEVAGPGACAGTKLSTVLNLIRGRFSEVSAIGEFRGAGPRGAVAINAGPAVRQGETPPPATGTAGFVVGFVDAQSFGIDFFAGQACRGEQCEVQEHWYFETDTQCRPRWVGHVKTTERKGGVHGTCFEVEGIARWQGPGAADTRGRCDTDWSAQNISGTHPALSLNPAGSCGGHTESFIPVEVTIAQGMDLAKGTLLVNGTGIEFLDGKPLSGTIERKAFNGTLVENTTGACPVRRSIKFSFDFEGSNAFGLPGGFGILDVSEETTGGCTPPVDACSASLHFIKRQQ
jgi:hypothetical protein